MTLILVAEDDQDIALLLRTLLERAGHQVVRAADGASALRLLHEDRPDLMLLDIGLPVLDGWTVLTRARELSDLPILMLTAYGQERDRVQGLRGGADDYVVKPFGNDELLARVEALLRRAPTTEQRPEVYEDGSLSLNRLTREARWHGKPVELSDIQFRLLEHLARNRGRIVSPEQLLAAAWDDPTGIAADRVKFAVFRLRQRLREATPEAEVPIEGVRGLGYRYG